MKIYKKKWLLEIRRMSGIQNHSQRKRRNSGRCYYRWRNYRNAFNKLIMYYHNSLIEAFAIPATKDDELARHLIIEAALKQRRGRE